MESFQAKAKTVLTTPRSATPNKHALVLVPGDRISRSSTTS
jgi:hypothetical protein